MEHIDLIADLVVERSDMYRPEGLRNPFKHSPFCPATGVSCRACGWESGADAILDGLKKKGLYGEYLKDYIISVKVKPDDKDWAEDFLASIEKKGYLVFIPDGEEIPSSLYEYLSDKTAPK